MNRTKIEWVKNPDGTQGYTWNPITGCLNQIDGMCKGGNFPCYAYKLANGRLRSRYLANSILPTHDEPDHQAHHQDPFYPRFWPSRIPDDKFHYFGKLKQVKPRGIFVCDMGELFGDWIPKEWQEQIFRVIEFNPWHRFYLLTKQPQNLIKFSPFPDNCWVGVTATDAEHFAEACMHLKDVEAKVKYLSIEPYLGMIIGSRMDIMLMEMAGISQVIIGSQTKPYKPPKMKWIDEIVGACDKAGIPVFLKNNLMPLVEQVFGRENYLSPILTPDGDLRQEVPTIQ